MLLHWKWFRSGNEQTAMAKKPSMGRRKIKIEKIVVKNHLQVTFSKRRSGLFKKASELCTLCGADIAVVVFSPAGKVFSFGHPNVDSVVDRLLSRTPSPPHDPFHLIDAHRNVNVRELNLQLGQILTQLDMERTKGENLDNLLKTGQRQYWWEAPIGKLGLEELHQLWDAMDDLKKTVCHHTATLIAPSPPANPFFTGAAIFDQFEDKPAVGLVLNHFGNNNNNNNNNSNRDSIANNGSAGNPNLGYSCIAYF
ncbi:agamous-like MADS-box protein AGL62 [Andrographis paniculata]|uniref:agamous-like MADS-box protein AGL62 n=1 Tax=Andrographis paniculata TaxID=175694 RepID=UPI0021E8406E|nr:agamous-like MADS-box protein AGL62 [Andrographis paniculata]